MKGNVVVTEERAGPEWDDFVRRTQGGTFCHLSGWTSVMQDAMGHRHRGLVARAPDSGDEILGVLPLVEMRSLMFGSHLVSVPFLNYGGPVGSRSAVVALVEAAVSTAGNAGADTLQLRSRAAIDPPAPTTGTLTNDRDKVTVLLDLPEDSETLWTDLRGKVRSQVRRPRKDGMTSRVGRDQLGPFYDVFAHNMRDLGTPVLPRAFFESLAGVFGDAVVFAAVYADDVPVAGSCGFVFGDEYEMTWASSLREYNRSAPNMLLYWACMEEAIERSLAVFNFGRCTPGGGTHRFKLQWGGRDEPLHWKRWVPGRGDEADADEKGGLTERAIGVWQRLPLPVANRLGPIVSKRIPWY